MRTDDRKTFAGRAVDRSYVYGLLAGVYRKEPGQELLRSLRRPAFLGCLRKIGVELGVDFKIKALDKIADGLAVEYTRLFLGPGRHVYPYESAYCGEGHALRSEAELRVKNLIRSSDLDYRADFHDNPDHISVELEFMQKITGEEAKTWEGEDNKAVREVLKFEKTFIDEHLNVWVPEFSDRVIKQARLRFYMEMARLTKEYIMLEAREIKYLIKQVGH